MLNWRSLPVRLAATLAAGLPPESRSLRLLHGEPYTLQQMLQASIADSLHALRWLMERYMGSTEEPPKSIVQALLGSEAPEEESFVQSFDSPEEFEAALRAAERR